MLLEIEELNPSKVDSKVNSRRIILLVFESSITTLKINKVLYLAKQSAY